MGLFDAISSSASGMQAERVRMDVVSENLANAQTTKDVDGNPYRRKEVVFQEAGSSGTPSFASVLAGLSAKGDAPTHGVQVSGIVEDQTALKRIYDPGHPDADQDGYVTMPNVNTVTEMTDLIGASRAYEANVTAIQAAKSMAQKALEIGR
jgi:flagellar basal-body rod protein FlgC